MLGLRGVGKTVAELHFVALAKEQPVITVRRKSLGTFTRQDHFEQGFTDGEKALDQFPLATASGRG